MDWTPFIRQLYICSGLWTLDFMQGLCMGMPTVLIPQLRANQTVTDDQASWFMALLFYCGIPWVMIQAILINAIGRKKTHTIACISAFIAFVKFYFSTNINEFYIGQIFQGALAAALYTTNFTLMTECTTSNYRGVFLTIKSATFFWGILVSNAIGTFYHWQNIVILMIICVIYTLLNVIIWPESPLWLATKGKFVECSTAHRWLKGNDEASEKELSELLKFHEQGKFLKQQWSLRYFFYILRRKQYLKPVLLSSLLLLLYLCSGKLICTIYAIDVLKSILNSESSAYTGMLILDGFTVASMYLACVMSKFLKRRTLLIGFSSVSIIIMVVISIYLYLTSLDIIQENKYFSIFLLATYSITVSCGPMTVPAAIMGELLPLESRLLTLCMMALTFKIIYGTFSKMSLLCFKHLGMHGTFLSYAISSSICLLLIYFYVPETKDKTIHEIDDFLRGERKNVSEENNELMNANNSNK